MPHIPRPPRFRATCFPASVTLAGPSTSNVRRPAGPMSHRKRAEQRSIPLSAKRAISAFFVLCCTAPNGYSGHWQQRNGRPAAQRKDVSIWTPPLLRALSDKACARTLNVPHNIPRTLSSLLRPYTPPSMVMNRPSDDATQRLGAIEKWLKEHEIDIAKLRELCKVCRCPYVSRRSKLNM